MIPASVFHSITCCVAIRSSFGNSIKQFKLFLDSVNAAIIEIPLISQMKIDLLQTDIDFYSDSTSSNEPILDHDPYVPAAHLMGSP